MGDMIPLSYVDSWDLSTIPADIFGAEITRRVEKFRADNPISEKPVMVDIGHYYRVAMWAREYDVKPWPPSTDSTNPADNKA